MKQALTAKERVIKALLRNLDFLSPFDTWTLGHPLVLEYIKAMDEPHRAYHGWVHIDEMLREVDEIALELVQEPLRLRAGIIFHDAVCIPCATDNEERSFEFSTRFYRGQNLLPINDLIMATRHDFPFVRFGDDCDLICDFDLMIIGAANNVFDLYRMNIAQEYRGYCTVEEFDRGTLEFFIKLQEQANRNSIYRTETFLGRYESQARENIRRVIAGYGTA